MGDVATEANARYRYHLWRTVGTGDRRLAIVGLNPSKAGERVLDPTLRRDVDFAQRWGFSAVDKLNLFAYRDTHPNNLADAFFVGVDVIGPENDSTILDVCSRAATIVCAWGGPHKILHPKRLASRVYAVMELLSGFDLYVIETPETWAETDTQGGRMPLTWKPLAPRHPLMLPKESRLALWRPGSERPSTGGAP